MSIIQIIKIDPFNETVSMIDAEDDMHIFKNFAASQSATGNVDYEEITKDALMWMQYGKINLADQAFFVHPARVGLVCGVAYVTGLVKDGVLLEAPATADMFGLVTHFVTKEQAVVLRELMALFKTFSDDEKKRVVDEVNGLASGERIIRGMFH